VSHSPRTPNPPARKLSILIVDDNRDGADALAMLAEFLGHDVQTAYDGENALRIAASSWPDIAVLDLSMPGMDGLHVARQLRTLAAGRKLTLLALTGWSRDIEKANATQAAGFDAYLTKPVQVHTLEAHLNQLVAESPASPRD
jgi:CheY-like chemotaxis protein